MSDQQHVDADPSDPGTAGPHPALRRLDALVGTWRLDTRDLVSGETSRGTVTRSWMPGGFFLQQQTRTDGHGDADGVEYIGWDGAARSLRSMYFSAEGPGPFCSFALEYFWDVQDDRLTIWHGWKDSPARFSGTIDRDAGVVHGSWEWPGGGYEARATRQ